MFYAIPCASVLVLELLREMQQRGEKTLLQNRSAVIQELSILVACCDSLALPGHSNYVLCTQARAIFSKSLDSILNPPEREPNRSSETAPTSVPNDENMLAGQELPKDMLQDSIPEWSDFLESIGLQAEPWLDSLPQQWIDMPMDDAA